MGMNAAGAVFHQTRSPITAVQGRTRDLELGAGALEVSSMARIKRYLPIIVMAFTVLVGGLGMAIVDVSIVKAAGANATADAYAASAVPGEVVSLPGYPY